MLLRWRLRSFHKDIEEFTKHFLAALKDHNVVKRFRLIMTPSIVESLDPVKASLQNVVKDLQHTVATMQDALRRRDDEIVSLRQEVSKLKAHQDHLEQQSHRASVRVFGIPENTPGSTVEKLLDICNNVMNLKPPLCLEEVEVLHRVRQIEKKRSQLEDGEMVIVAKPRPIIVKFVSRRTKAWVMAARKDLHRLKSHNLTHDTLQAAALKADAEDNAVDEDHDGEADDDQSPEDTRKWPLSCRFPKPVYISDDLMRDCAKTAYEVRVMKRQGLISDTWVFDCSILIEDNKGHIKKISNKEDLKKYARR